MGQNRPTVYEFNCTTNEEIVREMNDEEYNQYLLDLEEVTPTPALEG